MNDGGFGNDRGMGGGGMGMGGSAMGGMGGGKKDPFRYCRRSNRRSRVLVEF